MSAPAAILCPSCGEVGHHRRECPEWESDQARARTRIARADAIRTSVRRRVPSAAWALRWYATTRSSWASARGLPIDPEREGSGAPNRGADDPKRQLFAAVAWAIHLAEKDDQARYRTKPAPLLRWILHHFGAGRAYAWLAEETNGVWTEIEVSARVERALRVVRDRLRERGWMGGSDGD